MYNELQKNEFIRYYTTSVSRIKLCVSIFIASEPYENEWGADLCTMDLPTAQRLTDNITGIRSSSKWTKLIALREYVKWCRDVMHIEGVSNGIFNVNIDGIDMMRERTVVNPLHLQRYLDAVYDSEDRKGADNAYRCYHWLAYGGVREEDIVTIKDSDVDLSSMVVNYKDTEIPIYREAIPAFKNCITLTGFTYNHPNYGTPLVKPRASGNILLRGISSPTPSTMTLRVEVSRTSKEGEGKTSLRLSYNRLWLSGVFYRMYEREMLGEEVNFKPIVAYHIEGKEYKISKNNPIQKKKRKLEREYAGDYARWKLAYKLK